MYLDIRNSPRRLAWMSFCTNSFSNFFCNIIAQAIQVNTSKQYYIYVTINSIIILFQTMRRVNFFLNCFSNITTRYLGIIVYEQQLPCTSEHCIFLVKTLFLFGEKISVGIDDHCKLGMGRRQVRCFIVKFS